MVERVVLKENKARKEQGQKFFHALQRQMAIILGYSPDLSQAVIDEKLKFELSSNIKS